MDHPLSKVPAREVSEILLEIPDPPQEVWMRGTMIPRGASRLAVVGSRNYSNYGKQAVEYLIGGLRDYPVAIISGLALGIDAIAHTAALNAGLYTLAVPGSGIDDSVLYPRTNRTLARRILDAGGGLLSEFEPKFVATPWSFPQRNRIMVGLADAVLLIEAGEKSGTLITARLAADYNRELLVVPGNIFAENSRGTHQFLKLGATPITTPEDILAVLGLDAVVPQSENDTTSLSSSERTVIRTLTEPCDHNALIRALDCPADEALMLLMQMELKGLIKEQDGVFYKTM